ncbi:SusC/RagA family TonB-linked outer membrane protein [Paraflavitalea soli]|nr:TonB-dependent receptor [Paraflavitalea soli]
MKIAHAIPLSRDKGVFPKLLLLLMTLFGMASLPLQAQTGAVSGTVSSETNEPLAGASISATRSGKTVVADAKGKFSLDIAAGDTLVVSYAGYTTGKIAVGDKTVMTIRLKEEAKMLEEVSIGYQRLRKSDLTGAVSSVKSKELNLSSPTLSQALVGKVAGVQVSQVSGAPYSGTKIRVRGIGSINASSEPLYVVDGYPVGGTISSGPGNGGNGTNGYNPATSGNDIFINPDDIESIEILKDAASAAIYGSRAAGGVVLITTKRGRQGKGTLAYDYQVGVNQLAKKVDMLDAYEFAQLFVDGRNGAYKDQIIAQGIPWNDAYYSDDNAARIARLGSNPGNITIIKSLYDFQNQKVLQPQYNTDWQDALYRNALVQRHNFSFSGGNNGTRYMISGGYQDQPGIIVSTFQKRINLRANIDADVTKKLKVSSSMFVTNTNNREVQEGRFNNGPILGALVYMPFFPLYNPDGSLALGAASTPIDGYTYAFQGIENPVALAQRVNITRKGTRGTFNTSATYEFIPGLSGKVNIGAQTYNEKYEYYYPTNLSSGANPPGSPQAIAAANASAQTLTTLDKLAEFTLTYKKKLGKGDLNVLAGYTAQETNTDVLSVTAKGFSNDLVPELTAGGANAADFGLNKGVTGKTTTTLVSYLARAIYSYDNKYYLTGSFRTDGSSRFGPQNRWGNFPSISAGWNLSNEKFYDSWLGEGSTVRLRASWGLSGNNNIGNYNYEQALATPTGTVIGNSVVTANAAGNIADKKLGWESTSQYNFGADLNLLNNRLSVILNYYISKSYNLLVRQNITSASGYSNILTNLKDADIRNNGLDAQIDAKIIATKDFNLNLSGNITFNKNEVKSLGGASTIYSIGAERTYITHVTQEGQPIGMFYGFKVAGMVKQSDMANIAADDAHLVNNAFPSGYKIQGPPRSSAQKTPLSPGDLYFQDTNGDGIVTDADKTVIGTPYPDFTYGFNLSISYKQLDLSASFNGSQGNDVIDGQDYYIKNMEGSGNNYSVVKNRYRSEAEPGDGKIYRASRGGTQSNSTRLSDFYLQDGSFFRCTNITLGYNLGSLSFVKKLGFNALRVYGSVDNAFTVTKYLGYNPEVDYNNGVNLTPGVDYGKYPLVRAFSFGVKMQF